MPTIALGLQLLGVPLWKPVAYLYGAIVALVAVTLSVWNCVRRRSEVLLSPGQVKQLLQIEPKAADSSSGDGEAAVPSSDPSECEVVISSEGEALVLLPMDSDLPEASTQL